MEALIDQAYYLPVSIAITELQYHSAPSNLVGYLDGDLDFVEFTNTGNAPIDLTPLHLGGAIWFDFVSGSVASLAPGERVLSYPDLKLFKPDIQLRGYASRGNTAAD